MLVQTIANLAHPKQAVVWQLLATIPDPEIPVITIAELGMLRGVTFEDEQWVVTFTPTYSGCPATEMLMKDITDCMTEAGYTPVKVNISLDPAWTTDWMTDESKRKLTAYGIAPPEGKACFSQSIPTELSCPHCNSKETQLVSEFGSTACKAHYKCRTCYEPFDYFKCI
ncbi:phenylacetate-CoA oxygenase subunit PaaJ [Photobacterium makurazakiensis]|uniref:1,2-phenylacetyl-CoA epoxidase subunit PaaD n=1 Tax=Photobacterium makurazakiensis TaxID=2910234 RepID=UPI003D09741B